MRARTNLASAALVAIPCLAGCTSFESEYERGVYDYEPLYCYQTLGGVDCHRQPHHRDAARLVNYYGPAPSKYDAPEPPEASPPRPPPKVTAAYGPGAPNGAPSSASEVAAGREVGVEGVAAARLGGVRRLAGGGGVRLLNLSSSMI